MHLSVATANLYSQPFEQTLEIIAEAGFQKIELDLFWERKEWAMAQHLKDLPAKQVVRWIERSGLRITSIHDGGGVIEDDHSISGYINPALDEYLDHLGYAPDCLVFHAPHIEGNKDMEWWKRISDKIVNALDQYRKYCSFVTIENEPLFSGYYVSLSTPEELNAFTTLHDFGVTLDTNHYAQMGIDIVEAAKILKENVKTIHLSDYLAGRTNVFIGEGELDFPGFFDVIDRKKVNAITIECSISLADHPGQEMSYDEMVSRMRGVRVKCEQLL